MLFRTTAIGAAALALAAGFAAPARANLVTDPGFESCIHGSVLPPGWTGDASCSLSPHSGTWDAAFSLVSGSLLSQSVPTTVGDTYDFSFWFRGAPSTSGSSFTASFGADQVLDVTTTTSPYTFENFVVTATTAMTTIQFARTFAGTWNLDDVSVTLAPEPASLTLLAMGLAGLGMVVRLRRG
jgi:hypothetical protein